MTNLIPFDFNKIPAHLQKRSSGINDDLISHQTGGFPSISIKGKVFSVVRDGERKVLPNPKDPDSPATAIEVVILKGNKGVSKVFYAKGYVEGEATKPDCYSNEGVRPESNSTDPQSKLCATCPKAQWGSKINENGSKGKACQDSKRLAIATTDRLDDPYLLRVPPASLRPLSDYVAELARRKVDYNAVVTRIGMDADAATPKLTFKPSAFLDDEAYIEVQNTAHSEIVNSILGSAFVTAEEAVADDGTADPAPKAVAKAAISKAKKVTTDEVESAIEAAVATPEPAPKAAKKEMVVDLNLDDLNFDD